MPQRACGTLARVSPSPQNGSHPGLGCRVAGGCRVLGPGRPMDGTKRETICSLKGARCHMRILLTHPSSLSPFMAPLVSEG